MGVWGRRKRKERTARRGLFVRLARDRRGNTLAMMAALLIPLIGMVGSGIDMSRAYMAKAKLQTACDSAATAARRVMGAAAFSQAVRDEGTRFFRFNFPDGLMRTAPVALTINPASNDASVVQVDASTNVPTEIMGMFGARAIPISVSCQADKDYVNNDIMLVLDVTGSMNCPPGVSGGCATERPGSKLGRLRSAAAALYRSLKDATGVRTRYGFMPYSTNVNVGKVGGFNQSWLLGSANYQTCSASNRSGCYQWTRTLVNHNSNWFRDTFGGCIEERSTIALNGSGSIRISADVQQADIDAVSTTDNRLRWAPFDPDATTGWSDATCPAPAARLLERTTESAFQAQVDAALADVGGNTNHDIGMIWGMRFLSGTGMFAADNPSTFNAIPVRRHIVFLTDGEMTDADTIYSSYGLPVAERRLEGASGVSAVQRHLDRFNAACSRARQMGIEVWVIALDTVAGANQVRGCAYDANHFFRSDGSDLQQVFDLIGKGIGKLRLTR